MNQRHGFTIIELLVVLAISALLSGLAITYSGVGRNEVTLSIEESKIAQLILEAKELSIATYTSASVSCAYGFEMNIPAQSYSIFAYSPAGAPPCPPGPVSSTILTSDEQPYTQGTWQIPVSRGVMITSSSDSLVTVLFYPPDPTVYLMSATDAASGAGFESSPTLPLHVYLQTTDGENSVMISINSEGQVSF